MTEPSPIYAIFKNYQQQESFTCDCCHRVLKKAWSDEDAVAELRQLYPGMDASDNLVVCDDCFDVLGSVSGAL